MEWILKGAIWSCALVFLHTEFGREGRERHTYNSKVMMISYCQIIYWVHIRRFCHEFIQGTTHRWLITGLFPSYYFRICKQKRYTRSHNFMQQPSNLPTQVSLAVMTSLLNTYRIQKGATSGVSCVLTATFHFLLIWDPKLFLCCKMEIL